LRSSSASPAEFAVPPAERVVDFDASPGGNQIAAILGPRAGGSARVVLWAPGAAPVEVWKAPVGMALKAVTWHPRSIDCSSSRPRGTSRRSSASRPQNRHGAPRSCSDRNSTLRRLVVGPRPFVVGDEPGPDGLWKRRYRLFFGIEVSAGRWAIHSTTEDGDLTYQVLGAEASMTTLNKRDEGPRRMLADSARFHSASIRGAHSPLGRWTEAIPSGHVRRLRLEGNATALERLGRRWFGSPRWPNGLGILHWKSGVPGAMAVTRGGKNSIHWLRNGPSLRPPR